MALSAKLIGAGGVEHRLVETTRIGRSPACEIVIDDKRISRTHAKVRVDGHRVVLEDLGSTNGTWVNGLRIAEPVTLGHGDEIRFQRHKFILALLQGEEPQSRALRTPRSPPEPSYSTPAGDPGNDAPKAAAPSLARKATGAHLVVPDNDGGRVVELMEKRDAVWTIGRNEGCDVVLTETGVSGRHAQLLHNRGRWRLVNLVSASSTLVNGKRSQKTFLVDGDEIRLGLATMMFHTADELVGFAKWRMRLRRLAERFPRAFLVVRIVMAPLVFVAWLLNTDFDSIVQMVDQFWQRLTNLMP